MPETGEDKQWQIEADARTLVEAEMIKLDQTRKDAALAYLEKENKARAAIS